MAIWYRPAFQTQVGDPDTDDRYDRFNCAAESAAMAFDYATLGGVQIGGEMVRALSDEPIPDPKSPGLNLPQIAEVARKLHIAFVVQSGETVGAFRDHLRHRQGALVSGLRGQLANIPCPSTFVGAHTVFVGEIRSDDTVLVYDPLCKAPHWVDLEIVRRYSRALARVSGYPDAGLLFGVTRPVPLIYG